MRILEPEKYGPTLAALLREPRRAPLGPGTPNRAVRPLLEQLSLAAAVAPAKIRDPEMAACALAGLWLYHDFLDDSHRLSQDIGSPNGSFWHGIMHRREPDFWNSKYWFRRVGQHPIFPDLCRRAAQLAADEPAAPDWLRAQAAWEPCAFVDLCEAAVTGKSPLEPLCRAIQLAEWELLFDHCYRQAVGG